MPLNSLFGLFFSHLLFEIVLVVLVDLIDSLLESLIFLLPVLFVCLPHSGLHVDVGLLVILPFFLLFHLLCQKHPHLILLLPHALSSLLLKLPLTHFSLVIVLCKHFLFEALSIGHLLEHIVGHFVHEVLRSLFPTAHLVISILLLLIEHGSVLLLSFEVVKSLFFLLIEHSFLVSLVFLEHLLKILLLLLSLFGLKFPLLFHLCLQSLDSLQLMSHLLLIVSPLSSKLILQLQVPRKLIIHDLLLDLPLLLLLSLLQQLVVLLSHLIVETRLLLLLLLLELLRLDLTVELLADQALALSLSLHGLLLLLEVKHRVKFLDGIPLLQLVQLWILLFYCIVYARRCYRI